MVYDNIAIDLNDMVLITDIYHDSRVESVESYKTTTIHNAALPYVDK